MEGKEPVSKRADKSIFEKDDIQKNALNKLIDNRLLVSKEEGGKGTVEVAHEALLRSWTVLQDLIRENEEIIILEIAYLLMQNSGMSYMKKILKKPMLNFGVVLS